MGISLANKFTVSELQVGVFYICYGIVDGESLVEPGLSKHWATAEKW